LPDAETAPLTFNVVNVPTEVIFGWDAVIIVPLRLAPVTVPDAETVVAETVPVVERFPAVTVPLNDPFAPLTLLDPFPIDPVINAPLPIKY